MTPDTSTPDLPKRTTADIALSVAAWMAAASAVAFVPCMVSGVYAPDAQPALAKTSLVVSLLGVFSAAVALVAAVAQKGIRAPLLGPLVALGICGLFAAMSYALAEPPRPYDRPRSSSNIRQLALAVQQYSNDYDGAFPGWLNLGTKARPRYVHNVWDRQIDRFVKSRYVYENVDQRGVGPGTRSPSSSSRVIGFALNGALIARYKDGNCDWSRPNVLSASALSNPANTILFAQIVTRQPMGGMYSDPRVPGPPKGPVSEKWAKALTQWIDIDPKAWVETSGLVDSYESDRWDATRGIARDLYGGGGFYAFCDGHVSFNKIANTVTGRQNIDPSTNWSATAQANTIQFNQWYPG